MTRNHHKLMALVFIIFACGCGGEEQTADEASNNSKTQQAAPADSEQDAVEQQAVQAIAARLAGEWLGGVEIVDAEALRRHGETIYTEAGFPDPAIRKTALNTFVTEQHELNAGIKHLLVINKDGTCAQTSTGTGAYSDGTAKKGTWEITNADGDSADMVLKISGHPAPYVLKFENDSEFTLRISKSMKGYGDAARAIGERYKKK